MSLSARKVITEPTTVRVKNFHPVTETLGVISYDNADGVHVDDMYNVSDAAVLETLKRVEAGAAVDAVLQPDGPDVDGHPEVSSAVEVAADAEASA